MVIIKFLEQKIFFMFVSTIYYIVNVAFIKDGFMGLSIYDFVSIDKKRKKNIAVVINPSNFSSGKISFIKTSYHMETSQMICKANQLTVFYMK